MSSRTDAEIVAASHVDPDVFAVAFERHFVTIHGYLTRRLGRDHADDVAAEVFRIAFTNRNQFDTDRGDVRPWLYGIANKLVRQHLRTGERAERVWTRIEPAVSLLDETSLVDRVDAQIVTNTLQDALRQLLPADREALVLHVIEYLTYAEVADVTDTPLGTVKSRIARARHQLKDTLATTGLTEGVPHG